MTLGSLFDGVGGWQLAATRAGIKPLWSSEIDKFCMAITRRHFPNTIQLGDINLIDAAPKVDIITAGSPCQDLSIAGKRSGINGERSRLFFKAIELVRRVNPQFFIWENVSGVLNVNGGKDFATVLSEITATEIPLPQCGFANAGVVDFVGGHLAYRILDAQYWGTPQRRKRIFLVADFTARRAAKILFDRQGETKSFVGNSKTQRQCSGRITCGISRDSFNKSRNAKFKPTVLCDLQPSLTARGAAGCLFNGIIRKLTPLEEERLMGLPDHWTAGGSDAQRYKALGNGMAQPCADWILKGIKRHEHD